MRDDESVEKRDRPFWGEDELNVSRLIDEFAVKVYKQRLEEVQLFKSIGWEL